MEVRKGAANGRQRRDAPGAGRAQQCGLLVQVRLVRRGRETSCVTQAAGALPCSSLLLPAPAPRRGALGYMSLRE